MVKSDESGMAGDTKQVPFYIKDSKEHGFRKFLRYFLAIIIIFVVVFLTAIYAYGNWDVITQVASEKKGIVTDPVTDLYNLLKDRVYRAGTGWDTETDTEVEDKGIIFNGFSALTPTIPSGSKAVFSYDLSVAEDVGSKSAGEIPLELICKSKQKALYKKIDTTPLERNKESDSDAETDDDISSEEEVESLDVSSDDPSSYRNLVCEVETEPVGEDTKFKVEGSVKFTYSTKDISLDVYFLDDESYEKVGKVFFEINNIDESLPIKSKGYDGQPVSVGIGTSLKETEKYLQPVPYGENRRTYVGMTLRNEWRGFVKEVKSLNLYLPEGATLKENQLSVVCPFTDVKSSSNKRGYNQYVSEESMLKYVEEFGDGKDMNSNDFYCEIEIDEGKFGEQTDSPFIKKMYMVSAEYVYEFSPKTAIVKILKETPEVESGDGST